MGNPLSVKDVVEPIRGGYWGEPADRGIANARIIRNGDILEDSKIGSGAPYRKLTENELERARVRLGDILITVSGNVGRVAFVREECDEDGTPYAASNFVKILRAKPQVLPEFLLFFLRSRLFLENLKRHTRGVAIQNLSSQAFEEKILSLPDIAVQKAAAAVLKEAEELHQKRVEANKKMEELTSAMFQSIFGTSATWSSQFKMKPLGEVVKIASGSTPSKQCANYWGGKIPWVSAKDMKRPFIEDSIDHLTELALQETNVANVGKESILIVVRGMILARYIPICIADRELTINQDLKALTPKGDNILSIYLWGILQNSAPHLFRLVKTAAHGTKKLDTADLLQYQIPIPPLELQREFSQRVAEVRGYIKQQEQSTKAINELFHVLLERTFTRSKGLETAVSQPTLSPVQIFPIQQAVGVILQEGFERGEMVLGKVLYVAQEIYKVPLGVPFVAYKFGPWDIAVKNAVNGGASNKNQFFKRKKIGKGAVLALGPNAGKLFEAYANAAVVKDMNAAMSKLLPLIKFWKSPDIECLATVCKVMQDNKTTDETLVAGKVAEWKPGKFSVDRVKYMLDFIIKQGWDKKLI